MYSTTEAAPSNDFRQNHSDCPARRRLAKGTIETTGFATEVDQIALVVREIAHRRAQ